MSLIYRRIYQINAFIYCTDNIPDHRSRRFGCCPCQMAVRKFGCSQKKAVSRRQPGYGKRKMNRFLKQSLLPFYHIITAYTRQADAGQFVKYIRRTDMKKEISFEKNYLTVADIKSYLCISTTAAYELTHRKDFPVCRLGSSIRIPTQLFLAWVEKHTHIPADLASANKEVTLYVG